MNEDRLNALLTLFRTAEGPREIGAARKKILAFVRAVEDAAKPARAAETAP